MLALFFLSKPQTQKPPKSVRQSAVQANFFINL